MTGGHPAGWPVSAGSYTRGCRCDDCRAATAEAARERLVRKRGVCQADGCDQIVYRGGLCWRHHTGTSTGTVVEPGDGRWRERAACTTVDGDWFPTAPGPAVYDAPRLVCAGCPVRSECLDYALANNEQHGMWGGATPRERRRMARARLLRQEVR